MARLVTDTDRAIIRLLQREARSSYAEISRLTGIPESTVRRRMDRMQQRGVIEFAILAEPERLGYGLRAAIGLRIDLRRLDEVAEALRRMEEVTFAAFLTGSFDAMVHVAVRSQEALVEFLANRLAPIEGIRSLETFTMPRVIKPGTAWVLPDGAGDGEAAPPETEAVAGVGRVGVGRVGVGRGEPGTGSRGVGKRRGRPRKIPVIVAAVEEG